MWQYQPPSQTFFTPDQRRQVEALFEAILPGSQTSPGATDADAAEYIDRFLSLDESEYYEIKNWKKLYADGLPALEAASTQRFGGRGVAQLSLDETTELLGSLAKGEIAEFAGGVDQRAFFNALRTHCIEGCFADPRWGGNRDGVMWRWFGYLQPAQEFRRDAITVQNRQEE